MATQSTPTSPAAWRPDQTAYVPGDVVPDALILRTAIMVGAIEGDQPSIRVPFVADDGVYGFTPEATEIADAAQGFSEVVITTNKVAGLGKYSFETLQQPEAAKLVVESLSRGIIAKADRAYLGNAAAPTGLLNTVGISDGGAVALNLDPLIDAVAGIEDDGGGASHIVASPSAWADLQKLKSATDSALPLLGAGVDAGQRSILGVPVLITSAMPVGELLVIDKSAVVAAQSAIRLARSDDAYFSSDVVALRISWRIGWQVMHPARVARLTTGPSEFVVTLGAPTAGTFDLSYRGHTTTPLAYNATAAALKSALAALDDGFESAAWVVTGAAGGPYQVTTPGGSLSGSGTGLTGGSLVISIA